MRPLEEQVWVLEIWVSDLISSGELSIPRTYGTLERLGDYEGWFNLTEDSDAEREKDGELRADQDGVFLSSTVINSTIA